MILKQISNLDPCYGAVQMLFWKLFDHATMKNDDFSWRLGKRIRNRVGGVHFDPTHSLSSYNTQAHIPSHNTQTHIPSHNTQTQIPSP